MVVNPSLAVMSLLALVPVLPGSIPQAISQDAHWAGRILSASRTDPLYTRWETRVAQLSTPERYDRLADQFAADLRQLHPDIVDVRASATIRFFDDGSNFVFWNPSVTLRSGLSLEEQAAIALQLTEFVIAFRYEHEGSLFPTIPNYDAYGGVLLFLESEDEQGPQVRMVSYRILSRDPVAAEVSLDIRREEETESEVVGRVADGAFVALAPDQPDPAVEAARLVEVGKTQLDADNLPAARQSLEAALQIYRDLPDNEQEFWTLDQLVTVYDRLGEVSQADTALQRQADLAQMMQDPLKLQRIGSDFQCRAQWDTAVATYAKARDIYQRNRPDSYSVTDALTVDMELTILASTAQTLIRADRLPEAEATLQEAVALLDTVFEGPLENSGEDDIELDRQIRNFSEFFNTPFSSSNLYQMLQRVLIAQGKTDEALVAIEKGRTQALEELWAIKQPGTRLPAPTLQAIQAVAQSHDATLVTYSFNTFIDICEGESVAPELLTWVIPPTGEIRFHAQPIELSAIATDPDDLQNLVQDTRTTLGVRGLGVVSTALETRSPDPSQERPYLRSLHQLLIEPIANSLSTDPNDRVIFIPDFVLFMVPFPALQDENGSYLIERHTLLTAPSIQALALTEQSRQRSLDARSNPLIVGNPTYSTIQPIGQEPLQFPPLPGAEQEAIAIGNLLNTPPLIGDQATKKAILQQFAEASLLHFATHGLLEGITSAELPGAIAVAQSGDDLTPFVEIPGTGQKTAFSDNGLISTREILAFRLQAELVVLSACNTGGGELTGDGVTGLSRAFIAAGVPSVMVSLWSVPDAPTGEMMEIFYQEWLNGADKAQALRAAMLSTLEKYPDPINWAAFTLIGEAD